MTGKFLNLDRSSNTPSSMSPYINNFYTPKYGGLSKSTYIFKIYPSFQNSIKCNLFSPPPIHQNNISTQIRVKGSKEHKSRLFAQPPTNRKPPAFANIIFAKFPPMRGEYGEAEKQKYCRLHANPFYSTLFYTRPRFAAYKKASGDKTDFLLF